ncbi:MAG: hypothetical protein IJ379_03215 [Lachnospiraceae bacterium]|nr:hypothetical protein [Lachnospiraceae bacterium]
MTRDKLLKECMPDTVCMNPVGRCAKELTTEEFEECYKVFFDSILEISQADISGFEGYGELDEENQPEFKTLTEFLVGTFDNEQEGYWYHWQELFETSMLTREFFETYYEKMLKYSPYCEGKRYLVNNNTFFVNMVFNGEKVGFPDWTRAAITDFLLDFAIMDLNKPYLKIPEKLWGYVKERDIEIPHFKERFLCMAYYKGIATLMWHASIDDLESCTTIIASIKELEERIMAL